MNLLPEYQNQDRPHAMRPMREARDGCGRPARAREVLAQEQVPDGE